jgi:hypothetical protein
MMWPSTHQGDCRALQDTAGDEDEDLLEGDDAEAEGDPEEMEKALFEIRKLVAQVSELSA